MRTTCTELPDDDAGEDGEGNEGGPDGFLSGWGVLRKSL